MSPILNLSAISFWTAIEVGLIYALVGIAIYLSFRVLDFPDLTVDGSFPLGGAITASLIVAGVNPWLATLIAIGGGMCAGLATAFLNVWGKILNLLASILTMIALFSISIRVMGRSNVSLLRQETILTPFENLGINSTLVGPIFLGVVVLIAGGCVVWFLSSNFGLGMRATGANPRMARSQGISTGFNTFVGMALSNGLVALAGSLFTQTNGFADITTGTGTIVVGLAALIIGETLFPVRRIWGAIIGCVIGSLFYRLALQEALEVKLFNSSDLKLITAILVAAALIVPRLLKRRAR